MNVVMILLLSLGVVLADDFYDSKYDDFDAEALVSNHERLKSFANCFLEKEECTDEGAEFKKMLVESLSTNCSKCSPKQRDIIRTMAKGFQSGLPDMWTELIKKHDPESKYTEELEKFLSSSE